MRLTPSDLSQATFSKASLGGYRHDEVNDLLDRAAETLEAVLAENDDLRAQVSRLRSENQGIQSEERALKETLLSAQRAAELLREDARREASKIREEARRQAVEDRTQAQKEALALQEDVGRLQTLRQRLLTEQRSLVERLTGELDSIEAPLATHAVVAKPREAASSIPAIAAKRTETPSQPYPTRLPSKIKPLEPVIVEDENGEKWVS